MNLSLNNVVVPVFLSLEHKNGNNMNYEKCGSLGMENEKNRNDFCWFFSNLNLSLQMLWIPYYSAIFINSIT